MTEEHEKPWRPFTPSEVMGLLEGAPFSWWIAGQKDADGVPFLAPEVQLFYKAKAPRPKDVADFGATLPLLGHEQKTWLKKAIIVAYGPKNSWLPLLDDRAFAANRRE